MSRWLEKVGDDYKVTIANTSECKCMYYEIYCNDEKEI